MHGKSIFGTPRQGKLYFIVLTNIMVRIKATIDTENYPILKKKSIFFHVNNIHLRRK